MSAKIADQETKCLIKKIINEHGILRIDQRAQTGMSGRDLTIDDVEDAIVKWIDDGEKVKQVKLHRLPGMIGETAYEMKPNMIENFPPIYIKLYIGDRDTSETYLHLISLHMSC